MMLPRLASDFDYNINLREWMHIVYLQHPLFLGYQAMSEEYYFWF